MRAAVLPKVILGMKFCAVDDCDERVSTNGYCQRHQYSYELYGDPMLLVKPRLKSVRFKSDNLEPHGLTIGEETTLLSLVRALRRSA